MVAKRRMRTAAAAVGTRRTRWPRGGSPRMTGRRLALTLGTWPAACWYLWRSPTRRPPRPLSQQAASAQAKVAKVKAELESLRTPLEATIQQYDLANIKLTAAQKSVEQATYQLQIARSRLIVAQERFTKRIVAIYEQPPLDVLDVIFSAHSFTDISTTLQGLNEISASDSAMVSELARAAALVQAKRDALVVARSRARAYFVQASTKKASIESAVAQQQHSLRHCQGRRAADPDGRGGDGRPGSGGRSGSGQSARPGRRHQPQRRRLLPAKLGRAEPPAHPAASVSPRPPRGHRHRPPLSRASPTSTAPPIPVRASTAPAW